MSPPVQHVMTSRRCHGTAGGGSPESTSIRTTPSVIAMRFSARRPFASGTRGCSPVSATPVLSNDLPLFSRQNGRGRHWAVRCYGVIGKFSFSVNMVFRVVHCSDRFGFPSFIKTISKCCCSPRERLSDVALERSSRVPMLGESAFSRCSSLEPICIP